jgi:hypothetical protein
MGDDSFFKALMRQLIIVCVMFGISHFFKMAFDMGEGAATISSAGVIIILTFIYSYFKIRPDSKDYKLLGWLTYWLHSRLENNTKYRGIFYLEQMINSYMGLKFKPNNGKSFTDGAQNMRISNTISLPIYSENVIYELNSGAFLVTYGLDLNLVINNKKISVCLVPFNKYAYFGFMLWNLIIRKRLGDLEPFNDEMTLLLIEKV